MPTSPTAAGFQELHRADVMRPDAAMQADLHDAPGFARGFEHRAAFIDRMAGRFFDEDVRAGFERVDGVQRVPMVRRGDDDDVRLFLFEQFAVILVGLGRIAGQSLTWSAATSRPLPSTSQSATIWQRFEAAASFKIFLPHQPRADQRGAVFRADSLAENVRSAARGRPARSI